MIDRWGRADEPSTSLFDAVLRSWFRVEWEGVEHLPRKGGALLVSNHAGMFPIDGGVIQQGVEREVGRPVYTLAHHGFWSYPFVGTMLSRAGAVVGHPGNAERLMGEDGRLLLVFPEGAKGPTKPPSQRYRLQRFGRGGFVETAMRAGVPIVPIALMGTEDTTPMLATFKMAGQDVPVTVNSLLFGPVLGALAHFPAKIRARVLPPVSLDEPPGRERYSPSVVVERSEAIRDQLQAALDDLLRKRRSVWRG